MYLKDVARAAGVSVATVSRVLANTAYPVRAQTRGRVLVAAQRLGYQPNGLARSLRLGHSNAIGVCVTTLDNPSAVATVDGIIQACRARNRQVQTTTTSFDPLEEASQLQLFRQERLAGVISFPSGAPAAGYLRLQRAGTPVVVLNRRIPGLVAPLVRHDFAGGYAAVVEHLAARGHRRIAAVLPVATGHAGDYARVWAGTLSRRRLPTAPELVRHVRPSPQAPDTREAVQDLLRSEPPPTALFAATAVATLIALRVIGEGRASGEPSVALVGTGDERWEVLFPTGMPFLCLNSFSLGREAARILNDLIDGGSPAGVNTETVIRTRFVDGRTEPVTWPAAGAGRR